MAKWGVCWCKGLAEICQRRRRQPFLRKAMRMIYVAEVPTGYRAKTSLFVPHLNRFLFQVRTRRTHNWP